MNKRNDEDVRVWIFLESTANTYFDGLIGKVGRMSEAEATTPLILKGV